MGQQLIDDAAGWQRSHPTVAAIQSGPPAGGPSEGTGSQSHAGEADDANDDYSPEPGQRRR